MVADAGPGESGTPLAEWVWSPLAARAPSSPRVYTARERVVAALRAGHALNATFEIGLQAGRASTVTLSCFEGQTARWVTRVLVPAYGRASWIRQPTRTRLPAKETERGHRVRAWPERFRDTNDGPSAVGQLVLALTGIPSGVAVRWRFSPYPPTWRRAADREPEENSGARYASQYASRRPLRTGVGVRSLPPPAPLFWRTEVSIEFPSSIAKGTVLRGSIRRVVEGSLRSEDANGLRFAPGRFVPSLRPSAFPLSEEELASVLPNVDFDVIATGSSVPDSGRILPLGRSSDGRLVGPVVEPDQGRHIAVLGETGMGKSSTLVAVARRAAQLGGVILLDPLGETARSFVGGLTSEEGTTRLIWVSPRTPSCGINALEGIGRRDTDPVRADRRLNDLVHALRRVRSERYDSKYWGPRLEEMLTRALTAAAAFGSGTLEDAHTLLATGGRTRRVVPPEAQDPVRELADRVRAHPEDAEGARRLLYEVVRSDVLRRMICATSPDLSPGALVAPGRIAVISGEASMVGESVARYLLSVYLALTWSELLARPSSSKSFVVLDETQWFSHESLAEMLRLARRRNVHVVLATQTIGSLPQGVDEAVWTNVSDFVAFRGSPVEARELARATTGISVEELLALPRGHAAVLLGKGNAVEWVRTVGRPPGRGEATEPEGVMEEREARERPPGEQSDPTSRQRANDVLDWIRQRSNASGSSPVIRVELAEIRRSVDRGGEGVRTAGALLRRTGALVSSVKGASGSVWLIATDRLLRCRVEPRLPVDLAASTDGPPRSGEDNPRETPGPESRENPGTLTGGTDEGVGFPRKPS